MNNGLIQLMVYAAGAAVAIGFVVLIFTISGWNDKQKEIRSIQQKTGRSREIAEKIYEEEQAKSSANVENLISQCNEILQAAGADANLDDRPFVNNRHHGSGLKSTDIASLVVTYGKQIKTIDPDDKLKVEEALMRDLPIALSKFVALSDDEKELIFRRNLVPEKFWKKATIWFYCALGESKIIDPEMVRFRLRDFYSVTKKMGQEFIDLN